MPLYLSFSQSKLAQFETSFKEGEKKTLLWMAFKKGNEANVLWPHVEAGVEFIVYSLTSNDREVNVLCIYRPSNSLVFKPVFLCTIIYY